MGRILVIAEKPSVARDYARVLHCTKKGDGCLMNDQYVVSWAIGHLIELVEPEGYDPKYKRWKREDLPILPETMKLRVIRGSSKQFQILKKWMKDKEIDTVVCGTDSGREGELIFRYIYQMAGCRKPFQRLWVSSMTTEAITEGFQSLRPGQDYDSLYQSARCRSEADWLVGMNGSRAFSIRYNALLSIGRVQTPTLAMIVDRQKEIDAFVPQDYWEVALSVKKGEEPPFQAKWFTEEPDPEQEGKTRITTRIASEEQAKQIADRAGKGHQAQVLSVETARKKQQPPLLYDLTELQREGNRRFGYSASKVLNIAQELYEKHKLITYPRTDSRYLSDDMKETVRKTLYALDIPAYHPFLMGIPGLHFTGRIIDNSKITDHHAIIPTPKKPDPGALSEEARRIYDLIAMRLITVFYPPYEYETTTVTLAVGEDTFLAKGRHVIQQGFMALAANQPAKKKKNPEEAELPALEKGEVLDVLSSKVLASKTSPPTPFTEATLLSAMEYAGRYIEDDALREQMKKMSLGTPATRAATIERLLKVGYITRKGKTLLPTEKGTALIGLLPKELRSPEMTARWERALERIYQGTMEPDAFMESIRRYVQFIVGSADQAPMEQNTEIFARAKTAKTRKRKSASGDALGTCPLCGKGQVRRNSKAYYCTRWNEDCRFTVWLGSLDRYGDILDDDLIREILANGQAVRPVTLPQTGEKADATFYFNEKGALEMKDVRRKEAPNA